MVKADAYGHGIKQVSKAAQDLVDGFGVATAETGAELRGYTNKPIMVTAFYEDECDLVAEYRLTPLLSTSKDAYAMTTAAHRLPYPIPVHIKINSGMNRLGVSSSKELFRIAEIVYNGGLKLQGLGTHYYSVDRKVLDLQTKKFLELCYLYKSRDRKLMLHASSSTSVETDKKLNFDMVRVGLLGYGYSLKNPNLLPAMTVKTKIRQINNLKKGEVCGYSGLYAAEKDVKIGIISGGYYDGIPINRKSAVYINGSIAPVIGRTMMDLTAVNLDGVEAKQGDDVYLLSDRFDANKVAKIEGTIPYEILTRYRVRTNGKKTYEQTGSESGD